VPPVQASPRAQPAPTPAPAATGTKMVVTSDPPGATLTVDGRSVGVGPYELKRPPGTIIEIVARLDGHLSTTRLARFQDTESTTVVQLSEAPKPADAGRVKVTVTSTPWAYVAVDGVVTGKSTPVTLELTPGPHTITVENPLESWSEERSIVVKEGRASAVTFEKK